MRHIHLLLLLSGDIESNPGPSLSSDESESIWSPFKKRGLHFLHLNVNSLLPKVEELASIAEKTKAAVISITESKLDSSVSNNKVEISGYTILRSDRNRKGGGVACYVRPDLSFNQKVGIFSVEHILFDLLLPGTSPLTIGIFYRPPNDSKFLDNLSRTFETLGSEKNEIFLLGDFNIDLMYNGKYFFENNRKNLLSSTPISSLASKYREFCISFGLEQLTFTDKRS